MSRQLLRSLPVACAIAAASLAGLDQTMAQAAPQGHTQHQPAPTPTPGASGDDMDMMDMPGMDMGQHPHTSPKPAATPSARPASPSARPMPMDHGLGQNCPMPMETPMPGGSQGMAMPMEGMAMDPLMMHMHGEGSGTSLNPSASRMYMWSFRTGDWLWMAHGDLVAGYNHQDGPRGAIAAGNPQGASWSAENWAMLMGSRVWGPGLLDLRLMASLEAATYPAGGEPQLFQTGETYLGQPLVDKQHPHDLFMEVAARYNWNLSDQDTLFVYGGPAGEPALGPAAFMHRPSAEDNHWAPLAHHLEDSTHISYGVGTVGFRHGPLQLEGSIFNGREPDENRWDFDFGPLDSYSARLSYAPDAHWVAQISTGHLTSPEALEPGTNVNRTTASITNVQNWADNTLSTSLIWGQNIDLPSNSPYQGYTLESQLDLGTMNHLYGRFELVDKDLSAVPALVSDPLHRIGALTLGGVRELIANDQFNLGLGADATVYSMDHAVQNVYGYNPLSFQVYLRLRPPVMQHAMAGMPMDMEHH